MEAVIVAIVIIVVVESIWKSEHPEELGELERPNGRAPSASSAEGSPCEDKRL
jgi:hypothetical protein